MAIDFIDVDRSTKFGPNLVELSSLLRRAKELATATLERMNHMNDGANFGGICAPFGLAPGGNASAVGSGARTVVSNIVTLLDDAAVDTMIERVG